MDAWIRNLITSAFLGVKALADAAMERILWVYNTVVAIGIGLRLGWSWLTTTAKYWRDKAFNFASEIYTTLWYVIHVRIPMMVTDARNTVIAYLSDLLNRSINVLTHYVNLIRDWLVARLNEFLDLIRSIRDWARSTFDSVWDTLIRVRDIVFMLLTDPQRMAAWLAGALLSYVLRFIDENAEALLDVFRSRATIYAGRVAARIESMLVRLL